MRKKIFMYILAVVMLCATHTVYGQGVGDNKFNLIDGDYIVDVIDGNAKIKMYTGNDVNLVIPGTLGGYPVRFNRWGRQI